MNRRSHSKSVSISKSRWGAYAVAGAATALVSAPAVEGAIHYSGRISYNFDAGSGSIKSAAFALEPGAALLFAFGRANYQSGAAFFNMGNNASFRGISSRSFRYPSNLDLRQPVSNGNFIAGGQPVDAFMAIRQGNINSHFLAPGTGFIGFKFDVGNGTQYGWARVSMNGAPDNSFTLLDYAWADPGERLRVGQRRSGRRVAADSLPHEGSLGFLALGAAGLMAWRQPRSLPRS
ncbi:MAG: hypothetical protein ACR2G0_00400 [Chthoniobacterales bacterium]